MNSNWESNKRVLCTMVAILTVFIAALLMDVETGRAWAIVGLVTVTGGAVLLHLTKPVALTTSQATRHFD
jgi:hypothetical protein